VSVRIRAQHQWTTEEVRSFARAIHGHPTIRSFHFDSSFPYEFLDMKSITCSNFALSEEESALTDLESLTELLRIPTLRTVHFCCFYFTPAFCQAVANVLIENTAITNLKFSYCIFSAGECATIMANGFTRNTSVISIRVVCEFAESLVSALAMVLPFNSTLRDLSFSGVEHANDQDLSLVLLALEKNTAIKTLSIDVHGSIDDEPLCTAMKDGLKMNSTLESLDVSFFDVPNDAALWLGALSFLRTNKVLKCLTLFINDYGTTTPYLSSFRMDIAVMLEENVSLERLSIRIDGTEIEAEDYTAIITVLQYNTTLKTLDFGPDLFLWYLTADADKQMALLLKKKYELESLPGLDLQYLENHEGDVGAILRLNGAGRRYLIEDGSCISRGVEVLSAVSDSTNRVFLHLLENPSLCTLSATEVASNSADSRGSTSPTNHSGKQEHD
jgi:hypothetical protein